ncbi:MAG: TetR/AcrR family transcriptional regulator [Clostridia bacterium]|nr:TetR/AcrR family transcriptional regulator [Clostridia bacterium]MBQ4157442.1 TetR/AcrR family transcriptional regulator [Clostridia bacterium]
MRKGDQRRAAIIETAERLFYLKGYESTSVQDVLDELHLSKGGFYHHFESKLSLLEAICEKRTIAAYEESERVVREGKLNAVQKLNMIFGMSSILQQDSMDFIALMLRVAYHDGAVMLREQMKLVSMRLMQPLVDEVIEEGVRENLFFVKYPESMGSLLLLLGHNMTDKISFSLSRADEDPECLNQIVEDLKVYRYAIETLLNAPYGSIVLFDVARIKEVLKAISAQNRKERWEAIQKSENAV